MMGAGRCRPLVAWSPRRAVEFTGDLIEPIRTAERSNPKPAARVRGAVPVTLAVSHRLARVRGSPTRSGVVVLVLTLWLIVLLVLAAKTVCRGTARPPCAFRGQTLVVKLA